MEPSDWCLRLPCIILCLNVASENNSQHSREQFSRPEWLLVAVNYCLQCVQLQSQCPVPAWVVLDGWKVVLLLRTFVTKLCIACVCSCKQIPQLGPRWPALAREATHIASNNSLSGMRGCCNGNKNINLDEDLVSGIFSHSLPPGIVNP